MKRSCMFAMSAALLFPVIAAAQDNDVHHENFTLGGGAAVPAGNASNYLVTAPMFTFGYGYRFNRYLQADTGFQMAFGAANNQNAVSTDLGAVQGGDHEFLIPFGGRVYIPLPYHRLQFAAGGGAMYLHYSETAPSGGYGYVNNCYSCTSRGGWGGYGLGDLSYGLDSNNSFRVGATVQYVSATTSGQPVGNVTGLKSTDHWALLSFYIGLSF